MNKIAHRRERENNHQLVLRYCQNIAHTLPHVIHIPYS